MARRWWLVAFAVGSLVVLLYASIATALSVTVTDEMEAANRLPEGGHLAGARALVVPVPDPSRAIGLLVVGGRTESGFPSGAENVTMGRALAYVAPTANGSYVPATLEAQNVTFVENGTTTRGNLSVDVAALAGGKSGYIVKGDAAAEPFFLPQEDLLGTVARYETPLSLMSMFAFGSVGFLAPLIVLIVTQRKTGVRGVPGDVGGCPECRAPVEPGAEFCMRCGAWLTQQP